MDEETRSTMCCLQETPFRSKETQVKSERKKKDIPYNQNLQRAGMAILESDKIDF